ncbi:DUF3696 domain-containing protein [Empedobacter brevis]
MNINKIKLKNFKCYNNVEVELSQITLLTGANSSGKSSLLYSLLGTIQSREFPFQFSPNGKYVNMGDFTEIVHNHEKESIISIEFEYISDDDLIKTITTNWRIDKLRDLPILDSLEASSKFYKLQIDKVRKFNLTFEYIRENDPQKDLRSPEILSKIMESIDKIFMDFKEDKENNTEKKGISLIKKYGNVKDKIEFKFSNINELEKSIRQEGNYFLENIIKEITKFFNEYDDKINYISSFRLFPERTYYETSKFDLKVGKFGENYEDQIITWETTKHRNYKKLCDILKELGLLDEIKSKRLSGGRYEILVKNKKNGIWSTITDVGFGISQFLPIIVADLQLGNHSTLYIAQPEIHLHPKVQAQFADYIVNRVVNDNKKYVIETHSEYLLNRLRLAICEERISEKAISTNYIENNGQIAKHYKLNLLKNGQIVNAPESFFDTYMIDVMNIAINAK